MRLYEKFKENREKFVKTALKIVVVEMAEEMIRKKIDEISLSNNFEEIKIEFEFKIGKHALKLVNEILDIVEDFIYKHEN